MYAGIHGVRYGANLLSGTLCNAAVATNQPMHGTLQQSMLFKDPSGVILVLSSNVAVFPAKQGMHKHAHAASGVGLTRFSSSYALQHEHNSTSLKDAVLSVI